MIVGMTGYGRGRTEHPTLCVTVEIRTVNHRYSEVSVRLPRQLAALEPRLRGRVSSRLGRGRAEVQVQIIRPRGDPCEVRLNEPFVRGLISAGEVLRREFRVTGELAVEAVLRFPDSISTSPPADPLNADEIAVLEGTVDQALDGVESMRAAEGEVMARDMSGRIDTIGRLRGEIEERAGDLPARVQERLQERLSRLLGEAATVDVDRLAQEVAIMAEKSDVSEELVRLAGYLEQAREVVGGTESGAGKRLEFILQELNRETNTIGSKIGDLDVGQRVVEIKLELERIREQVQNVA